MVTVEQLGNFLQRIALALSGGIPQTALGFFAGTIREFLGIPDELKRLFGISFGYPDDVAPGNRVRMDRVPLDTSVTFNA